MQTECSVKRQMQAECLNPNTAKDIRAGSLKCVAMVVDLLNANGGCRRRIVLNKLALKRTQRREYEVKGAGEWVQNLLPQEQCWVTRRAKRKHVNDRDVATV